MITWEYMVTLVDSTTNIESWLNKCGQNGWEMVVVLLDRNGHKEFYFRRSGEPTG